MFLYVHVAQYIHKQAHMYCMMVPAICKMSVLRNKHWLTIGRLRRYPTNIIESMSAKSSASFSSAEDEREREREREREKERENNTPWELDEICHNNWIRYTYINWLLYMFLHPPAHRSSTKIFPLKYLSGSTGMDWQSWNFPNSTSQTSPYTW